MNAIHYMVGGEDRYLVGRKSMTREEYEAARAATALKDETAGYHDRLVGVYDKWYRYNRSDEGAAYDRGQQRAVCSTEKSTSVFVIIECAH